MRFQAKGAVESGGGAAVCVAECEQLAVGDVNRAM